MERKWFTDRGQGGRISIIIRVNGFASLGSMVSRSLGSWLWVACMCFRRVVITVCVGYAGQLGVCGLLISYLMMYLFGWVGYLRCLGRSIWGGLLQSLLIVVYFFMVKGHWEWILYLNL
jgi:uncharacterized membrane protein